MVKLTPTPVDDAVVSFLQKGLALLGGIFGQKAKKVEPLVEEKPEEEPLLKERDKTRLP